jgi:hypothetical protein
MGSIDTEAKQASDRAKAVMMPPADPSPEIPGVAAPPPPPPSRSSHAPSRSAAPPASEPKSRAAAHPPIPRKECRVIRVTTAEGVVAFINADDYDPDFKGHKALTPEDERWGQIAVEARQRADYEAEKVAAIKRVVRGG